MGLKIAMIGVKGIPATYGGAERHVEELAARLAAKGHAVTVYCRRHYTPATNEHRGVRLRRLPSVNTKHLDAASHTLLALPGLLMGGYDIIHFHSVGPAFFSVVPRALALGARVIATVHGLDSRRAKWNGFARWCLRRGEWAATAFPHRTIVVSRQLAEHYRARRREVVHIPNGVAPPERRPLDLLRRHGIDRDGYVLWLGRMVPEKRVEDLIAAWRGMPHAVPLVIAGDLDPRDEYTRKLQSLAAGDARIRFTGGLYGLAKAEAFTHAAAFVLPSELEGFPIVLLEAMRYGLPVLASDLPENLEALTPEVSGLTFRAHDVAALQTQLARLLDDAPLARALGQRAEQDAQAYDWDVVADRTEEVYRSVLRRQARA